MVGLAVIWGPPLMATGQAWPGSGPSSLFVLAGHEDDDDEVRPKRRDPQMREDPRTMTQGEWQTLFQKVAINLDWIGIQMGVPPEVRAVYVPALTQEHLQAFQLSLMQGATKPQTDILVSQYIFARIRQLAPQSGPAPGIQGRDDCVYSRGGSFCAGTDGFRSFSPW